MGGAKHLLPLDGVALAERVIRALAATSAARVSLVLAPDDAAGRALAAALGVRAVPAENADEGRAASVRAAVRACSADAAAILIALADQPFLEPADFERLLAAHREAPAARSIVRARYAGEPGTPVLFARGHFAELLALRGKDGGRRVIEANPQKVWPIDFPPDRGRDLDTPEDWPD